MVLNIILISKEIMAKSNPSLTTLKISLCLILVGVLYLFAFPCFCAARITSKCNGKRTRGKSITYLKLYKTFDELITHLDNQFMPLQQIQQGYGWRSGESARLPPMWLGFDSGPVAHVGRSLPVSGSRLSPRVFLRVIRCSSSLHKTNISKFQFDQDQRTRMKTS